MNGKREETNAHGAGRVLSYEPLSVHCDACDRDYGSWESFGRHVDEIVDKPAATRQEAVMDVLADHLGDVDWRAGSTRTSPTMAASNADASPNSGTSPNGARTSRKPSSTTSTLPRKEAKPGTRTNDGRNTRTPTGGHAGDGSGRSHRTECEAPARQMW